MPCMLVRDFGSAHQRSIWAQPSANSAGPSQSLPSKVSWPELTPRPPSVRHSGEDDGGIDSSSHLRSKEDRHTLEHSTGATTARIKLGSGTDGEAATMTRAQKAASRWTKAAWTTLNAFWFSVNRVATTAALALARTLDRLSIETTPTSTQHAIQPHTMSPHRMRMQRLWQEIVPTGHARASERISEEADALALEFGHG